MERGLQVKVIWKDNDMVEVRLSAWNGAFGGVAEFYLNYGKLTELAESLDGFPNAFGDRRQAELGDLDAEGTGGALFHLFTRDAAGRSAIRISLQTGTLQGSDQTVTLVASIEAAGVDSFVSELRKINDEIGPTAFLRFNLL